MKRILILLFLIIGLIPAPDTVSAEEYHEAPEDAEFLIQCMQAPSLQSDPDCIAIIDAHYARLEAERLAFYPDDPLESEPVPENFGQTDVLYARVTTEKAAVYSTLEDAVNRDDPKRYIFDGFNYVSYEEKTYLDGKVYYYIGRSEWMRGADLNSNIYPTEFSGVRISYASERRFGWFLYNTETYSTPGYGKGEKSGFVLPRHTMFEVYDTQVHNGYEWYLVEINQWVEQRKVALVYPRSEPPFGVENGRWIDINLFEQTVAVYENNEIVYATLVTTGSAEFFTRPGLFKIWLKLDSTSMRGGEEDDKYFLEDVLWTMYFDESRGLHGEYWHDHLGYKSSHGCVNLAFADADWLFHWAELGEWVYVWDPSGRTPVEPHLFTELIEEPMPEEVNRFVEYGME